MSEQAAVYYKKQADVIGVSPLLMPHMLLTGEAVTLLRMPERAAAGKLAARFSEEILPLGDYVREGIPIAYEAQEGVQMTAREWQHQKRALQPWGHYMPLGRFATRNMVPVLTGVMPLRGGIYMDALPSYEVPYAAHLRSMVNTGAYSPSPDKRGQALAQAHVVTRSVAEDGKCLSAHLTTVWAVINKPNKARPSKEYLTIRYLGAPLLRSEIADLPPLILPQPGSGPAAS